MSGGHRRFNAFTQRAGSLSGLVFSVHQKRKTLRVQAFHKSAREAKTKRTSKTVKACVTDKQAEHQEEQEVYAAPEPLTVIVKEGRRPDELRAAAVLRSNSFNVYPPGRSEAAAKEALVIAANLRSLENKLRLLYKKACCLLAIHRKGSPDIGPGEVDPRCQISNREGNWWVVGTLDLNQGQKLPGEDLVGDFPLGPDAGERRAYLSNVCVENAVRRRGVARKLIEEAKILAKEWGIEELYVHVLAENTSARNLYLQMGFVYEKEETPQTARYLGRPKRLLLRSRLTND
ncbi:hypothetical protein KFL_001300110 [Klebsormidium nitens]|uniref:N-acetyltransferase domain-containing protein n=1 Tax=Klebsormidium nitens TaxID=105231 RepID=A0A1Y1I4B6_KLENI|nr:hypothetical protein KFL_001300110 [Klebsormidium nitens]|eukprot:GAQ82948.1 hypothetical protein KFL_001300110 [Klebsormidium nitens]